MTTTKYRFSKSRSYFPVGANVPAVLSHCEYNDKRKTITLRHKTLVEDPRIRVGGVDKRGDGMMWRKIRSYVHVPTEWSKSDWDTFDRTMVHICRVLGIDSTSIRSLPRDKQCDIYTQSILDKVGAEYFLKTVVDISNKGYVFTYVSRKVPFMSNQTDLFYIDNEDKLNYLSNDKAFRI